ncbi:MAG: methyltransferase domain-containing protein [Candidatus Hodarchaeota archaeon]
MDREIEKNIQQYYADRANEYDLTYQRPERQNDLKTIRILLKNLLDGHHVLEVACGTGYWTKIIASVAKSITATDINNEVLQIAKSKLINSKKVTFIQDDSYSLKKIQGNFTAGFAFSWWSHILISKLKNFLNIFHSRLQPGALVIFVDNSNTKGSCIPISRINSDGNTYQIRKLQDGREYEILKNFPRRETFDEILGKSVKNLKIEFLTYFWIVTYNILK